MDHRHKLTAGVGAVVAGLGCSSSWTCLTSRAAAVPTVARRAAPVRTAPGEVACASGPPRASPGGTAASAEHVDRRSVGTTSPSTDGNYGAPVAFVEPVILTGDLVLLEPLLVQDHDALVEAAADGHLWTLTYTRVPRPEQMRLAIQDCLAKQAAGALAPFTVRSLGTGRVIGMTTYCNIDPDNRHLEIGGTWNARSAQQTGTNTESKFLLLAHAFDQLDCIAVEFRTHWLNHQSRRAIERLGAKQDGVLRSHKIMPDGTLRDTAVYSILQHEWPAVRTELRRRLAHHSAQSHLCR